MESQYMTTKELKELLKVTELTILRWRKEGLPHERIGYNMCRYEKEKVMAWLNKRNNKYKNY